MRGQVKNNIRSQFAAAPSQHNNIQKILMNSSGFGAASAASISSLNIPALSHSHLSQITPGGAELNILSSCTPNNNGNIYQGQGKLAIVKGQFQFSSILFQVFFQKILMDSCNYIQR